MGLLESFAATWERRSVVLRLADESWTGQQLAQRVGRAAYQLAQRGVGPGSVVALGGPRSPSWLALHLALVARQAVTLPVHPHYTAREVHHFLADAAVTHALLPAAQTGGWTLPRFDPLQAAQWLEEGPELAWLPGGHDLPVLLLYTSGTTGKPKGVVLRTRQLLGTVQALHQVWDWRSTDTLLHALPLVHIHGLVVAQYGALYAGACAHWLERFDPEATLHTLAAHPISLFMGVPTFYQRLVRHPGPWPKAPALRLVTSGSAGLPAALHSAFAEKTGHAIVERYGLTETGILTSNLPAEPVAGSVGPPLPGVQIRVLGASGAPCPLGEVGEVEARGPGVFDGYLNAPSATEQSFRDGWFRTGDLGHLDQRGRLWLSGRASELLLSGGYNVYPAEIDAVAQTCPGITEAASYAIADQDLGEIVGLAWVGSPTLTEPELLAHLRANLAPYKVPRVLRRVDALPRNTMGKVLRRQLSLETP